MKVTLNSPLVRIAGSIALLGLLAYQIDLQGLYDTLMGISLIGVVITIVLGVGLIAFNALRWSMLVDRKYAIPLRTFLQLSFFSTYAGLFMPGTIGTEAIRVGGLAAKSNMSVAAASVIVDRVLSLLSQFVMALVALSTVAADLDGQLQYWATVGLGLMVGGVALMMNFRLRAFVLWGLDRVRLGIVGRPLARFFEALDIYRSRRLIVIALCLAMVLQVLRGVFLWACAWAIGADIPIFMFLIALPLVSLIEILPISVAGVGPREAAFTVVLAQFGIPAEQSVLTSLLAFITGSVIASVIGFVVMTLAGLVPVKKADKMPQ